MFFKHTSTFDFVDSDRVLSSLQYYLFLDLCACVGGLRTASCQRSRVCTQLLLMPNSRRVSMSPKLFPCQALSSWEGWSGPVSAMYVDVCMCVCVCVCACMSICEGNFSMCFVFVSWGRSSFLLGLRARAFTCLMSSLSLSHFPLSHLETNAWARNSRTE